MRRLGLSWEDLRSLPEPIDALALDFVRREIDAEAKAADEAGRRLGRF